MSYLQLIQVDDVRTGVYRLHTDASAAAERSVLLVNYENQRNAYKLVDIKPPSSPAGVHDIVYASPRHWLHHAPSSSPAHLVAPSPAVADRCDCVYSADLRPCGCPRFLQTASALSASLPDVTSELQYAGADDDDDDDEPEVYLSRDGGSRPAWQSSTVCRGCANVDAGPVPTLGDQQQQQPQVAEDSVTCWRSDDDPPACCLTPQRRRQTSPVGTASELPLTVPPWQTST